MSKVSNFYIDLTDQIQIIIWEFDGYFVKIKSNMQEINKLIDKGRENFASEPEQRVM